MPTRAWNVEIPGNAPVPEVGSYSSALLRDSEDGYRPTHPRPDLAIAEASRGVYAARIEIAGASPHSG
jgi:hypothetical protein